MQAEKLRLDLVQLLERKGVHPDVIHVLVREFPRQITQSVYVTRHDLDDHLGPTLDFLIDAQGHGTSIVIDDVPSSRIGVSELQYGAWTLDDVERDLQTWLERLAALRGQDCPDCQGVPPGEVQKALQSGCDACRGIGRVHQAPLRTD
jgi:hypothetical protein